MRIPGMSLSAFLAASAAAALLSSPGAECFQPGSAHQIRRAPRSGWVVVGRTTTLPPRSSFFEDDFGEYSDFADAARSSNNNGGGVGGGGGGGPSNFPPATPADRSSNNSGSTSSSSSSSSSSAAAMSDDLFLASLRARRDELARTYASQARAQAQAQAQAAASSSASTSSSSSLNGNGNGPGGDHYVDDELRVRWLNADISSAHAGLALSDDWIRRVAFHRYPLAVCGTAGGSIVAADLESGEELCRAEG
eukprot:CAMPEP_0113563814 /NCGR_PEP_ID=MMETSP0015_2-20120614/21272_1 /TAXON_ID=2838 /ORGANISM="Odontella" /LENGTH=250 /DNA_ID=CAMNT_0000465825 /DNA_START=156 /DNA_END=904 /DNA_ORIENTATION=- /assembly_acc=CAM_ASM_000160